MEVDGLPTIEPDVDYTQILPIQQKRIVAFINHFIMNTVSLLNSFCQSCESRLMEFEHKMQKIEASLLILESQLSSISCLENNKVADKQNIPESSSVKNDVDLPEVSQQEEVVTNGAQMESNVFPQEGPKACEDARFVRFFKMVQFGVPPAAVKLKMEMEGVDPCVLDKPDAIIPGPAAQDST